MRRHTNVSLLALAASVALPPAQGQRLASRYDAVRHGGMYMQNYYLPPAPSSTPWSPTWEPRTGRITFSMAGSLWSIDRSGGEAREIVAGAHYLSQPDWAPDGSVLVYTADDGAQNLHLRAFEPSSGRDVALTPETGVALEPRIAPDGERLAFVTLSDQGFYNVRIATLSGLALEGEPVAVTYDHRHPTDRLYFGPWDMHLSPSWFPDSRQLLLVSNRDVTLGSGNVLRVPATTRGIEEATTVLREQTLYRARPDVSPDGARFVYSSTAGSADTFNNLYVQPTIGGEPYKITHFRFDAFDPRWSADGEHLVYVTNESTLPQLETLEIHGGRRTRVQVATRSWSRPMGRIRVEARVEGSPQPVPSRIQLRAADGKLYAPADAFARITRAGDRVFHHSGTFEVELPPGPVEIVATKGIEFLPERLTVDVAEGATAAAPIALRRLRDPTQDGWWSGSTHVHMNYGGNLRNTLDNLKLMSRAEGQHIVTEQIANKDNRVLDLEIFEPGGRAHSSSDPDLPVLVGQEYRPPFYGHVFMFGMRDHLVSPFATGYEGTAIESLYPSNTDMLRKAKEQGAVVGYVHSFYFQDPLGSGLGGARGFLVDAALGTTDAIEWSMAQNGFAPVYAAWSNDLRTTLVAGEDSISDLHFSSMLGSMRTYAKTRGENPDAMAWLESIRRGHAWITNGPLLDVKVEGREPGESFALEHPGGVELEISVRSIVPLEAVHVVVGGDTTLTLPFEGDRRSMDVVHSIPVERSTWVHVRAEGAASDRGPLDAVFPQAATNPVWIEVGGHPIRSQAAAEYGIAWVDELEEMAEAHPGWRSPREKSHVLRQFEEAREVYRKRRQEAVALGAP